MQLASPIRSIVALKQVHLFSLLSDERLEWICRECQWTILPPRQFLMRRSDHRRELHFIVSGTARVTSYSAGGRQVSFRDVDQGECVGILGAIDGEPRSADVIATRSCVLATLRIDQFNHLLKVEPEFARAVMLHLTLLVRQMSLRLIELSTRDVASRVHAELLRRSRAAGALDKDTARLDPFPSHEAIASLISTSREQVTREINRLIHSGLIRKERSAIFVTSVAELARLAHVEKHDVVSLNATGAAGKPPNPTTM